MSGDEQLGFVGLRKAETAAVRKKWLLVFQRAQTLNPRSHSGRSRGAAVREESARNPPPLLPKRGSGPLSQSSVSSVEQRRLKPIGSSSDLILFHINFRHRCCWKIKKKSDKHRLKSGEGHGLRNKCLVTLTKEQPPAVFQERWREEG